MVYSNTGIQFDILFWIWHYMFSILFIGTIWQEANPMPPRSQAVSLCIFICIVKSTKFLSIEVNNIMNMFVPDTSCTVNKFDLLLASPITGPYQLDGSTYCYGLCLQCTGHVYSHHWGSLVLIHVIIDIPLHYTYMRPYQFIGWHI